MPLQDPIFGPDSPWRPTNDYPDLSGAKILGVDLETYDPLLMQKGPGFIRRDGHICGFSLATDDGYKTYKPLNHVGGDNVESPETALRWLEDQLQHPMPKTGANLLYDLGWLRSYDIEAVGPFYDTQVAEPLIDENRNSYALGSLGWKYLKEWKDETLLKEAAQQYGIKVKDIKANLWKLPGRYVGLYGEQDADLPIRILQKQLPIIEAQGLGEVFKLEVGLIPLLLDMKFKGIRVDVDAAERLLEEYDQQARDAQAAMNDIAGFDVDIWSGDSIGRMFDGLGIEYNLTPKSQKPSITKPWLLDMSARGEHQVFDLILKARSAEKGGGTFVRSQILGHLVGDRIHPEFNALRKDDAGTVSGRFSSGLHNMPSKDSSQGSAVRALLIADERHHYLKADYSQQEPRLMVHLAAAMGLRGSSEAVEAYTRDRDTDFHQMVADMARLERAPAKDLNLGLAYGLGIGRIKAKFGVPDEEAERWVEQYFESVPFMRELQRRCMNKAAKHGFVKTLMGRRRRFELWEPRFLETDEDGNRIIPEPQVDYRARKKWGNNIKRAYTYKALNAVVQGGAADMIKRAMLDAYEMGYVPHLTEHDELGYSVECGLEGGDIRSTSADEIIEVMENCVELRVPLKVDASIGPSWGENDDYTAAVHR